MIWLVVGPPCARKELTITRVKTTPVIIPLMKAATVMSAPAGLLGLVQRSWLVSFDVCEGVSHRIEDVFRKLSV